MYKASNYGKNTIRGDKMNKNNFSKMLKSKGFYLSLLTGVLAIFALSFVYLNTDSVKNKDNLTDLNKEVAEAPQDPTVNADQDTPGQEVDTATVNDNAVVDENQTDIGENALLENDIVDQADEQGKIDNAEVAKENQEASAEESVSVVQQEDTKSGLSFSAEDELSWPIRGNVIINYNMDQGVYFATLGQYKCSDALVIAAEEGSEVSCAANAKVVSIIEDEETGKTVTLDIGNGYSLVYGQLTDLTVAKGDVINQGDVIGKIAKPTKYYVVEGPNLYFKVLENDETVNPMFLLK